MLWRNSEYIKDNEISLEAMDKALEDLRRRVGVSTDRYNDIFRAYARDHFLPLPGGAYLRRDELQVVPGVLFLWSFGWKLNVLSAAEEEAVTLGLRVTLLKTVLMGLAAYITSLCVSAVGIIAWVGLIIPHIARMLIGPDHRRLIPAASLLGAVFIVFCDTLTRVLTDGEILISIITAVTGALYLFFLIRTNRRIGFAS